MVGDIRYEVSIATLTLAHNPVFVVTKVGGSQPQRATFLVGIAAFYQTLYRGLNRTALVQR